MSAHRNPALVAVALAACLALGHPAPATATCPTPAPGEALPPEARAEWIDDAPWRARVAALEQTQVDVSAVQLLFLGDSITEAWDSAIFAQHFGDLHALNWGARGETTQGLLWRLPRMPLGTTLRPALIVLLIGTNDTWPGGNPRTAAIGVGEVVRTIQRMTPESRILLLGLLPRDPSADDPYRRMAMGMNRLIADCADHRSVFYADPGRRLIDASGRLSAVVAADYLHPTPSGYAILAADLEPTVRTLLQHRP